MGSTHSRSKSVHEQSQEIVRVIRALLADDFSARAPVGDDDDEGADVLRELNLLAEKLQSK